MYRPNFCAECGAQVVRAHWRLWTSRRFCDACAGRLRKARIIPPLIGCLCLFFFGLIAGRTARQAPPPLVIEQSRSPATSGQSSEAANSLPGSAAEPAPVYGADGTATERPTDPNEVVSICGARTKKGTPCSRRVRGTGRCWQHRGLPAMLPPEKLLVKDN
jgi:hypothetical protein